MAKKNISHVPAKRSKKEIRKVIQGKLADALADFRTIVGDKRFESHIRKMAKSFTADLLKGLPKKIKKEEG